MKKKRWLSFAVLLIVCALFSFSTLAAEEGTPAQDTSAKNTPAQDTSAQNTPAQSTSVQKPQKQNANAPGWHKKANGRKYYIKSNGKKATGWTKIKGKYYYFKKNGILYPKTGWVKIGKYTYFIKKNGSRSEPGIRRYKGKSYYFDKNGRLVTNKRAYVIKNTYYNISSKGVLEKISSLEAQCQKEAQKFISKHTNSSMTKQQKLRACFNYLLAYMRYRPQGPDWSEFRQKEWYYRRAINTFRSPTLDGNCYSFACTVAACAKELGYKPTVVVITADHGFVMIDGKYYDNMKGGLFGSATPSHNDYTVFTKAEF